MDFLIVLILIAGVLIYDYYTKQKTSTDIKCPSCGTNMKTETYTENFKNIPVLKCPKCNIRVKANPASFNEDTSNINKDIEFIKNKVLDLFAQFTVIRANLTEAVNLLEEYAKEREQNQKEKKKEEEEKVKREKELIEYLRKPTTIDDVTTLTNNYEDPFPMLTSKDFAMLKLQLKYDSISEESEGGEKDETNNRGETGIRPNKTTEQRDHDILAKLIEDIRQSVRNK